MEKFTVDGLVIRVSVTGESDRIVWVLTRSRGLIRAFAKGARGTKSKLHGGTSLFSYCDFSFYEKNNVYHVTEAAVREVFFQFRDSFEKVTTAQYFCEVMLHNMPESTNEAFYLRLMLNSLHFLCGDQKPWLLVKSVFELRFACEEGYMPSLVACDECGEFETDRMYFDCREGLLFCARCGEHSSLPRIPLAVVSAMRHIVYSDFERCFAFDLAPECLPILNRITEHYLSQALQQSFKTLAYLQYDRPEEAQ